jgi:hypothetical protein
LRQPFASFAGELIWAKTNRKERKEIAKRREGGLNLVAATHLEVPPKPFFSLAKP